MDRPAYERGVAVLRASGLGRVTERQSCLPQCGPYLYAELSQRAPIAQAVAQIGAMAAVAVAVGGHLSAVRAELDEVCYGIYVALSRPCDDIDERDAAAEREDTA